MQYNDCSVWKGRGTGEGKGRGERKGREERAISSWVVPPRPSEYVITNVVICSIDTHGNNVTITSNDDKANVLGVTPPTAKS